MPHSKKLFTLTFCLLRVVSCLWAHHQHRRRASVANWATDQPIRSNPMRLMLWMIYETRRGLMWLYHVDELASVRSSMPTIYRASLRGLMFECVHPLATTVNVHVLSSIYFIRNKCNIFLHKYFLWSKKSLLARKSTVYILSIRFVEFLLPYLHASKCVLKRQFLILCE